MGHSAACRDHGPIVTEGSLWTKSSRRTLPCRCPDVLVAVLTECVHGNREGKQTQGPEGRARAEFGSDAEAVLDVLELTEFAWHDCYGEVSPPDSVIDDVFVVARGSVTGFVRAARLAVEDFRDLRLAADSLRD